MPSPLFSGTTSLRYPRERLAFVLTLVFAFPVAYAIGFVIHERIGPPEVALFIVVAMLYVTLARGRLIGSSVMIHEAQYPRVFSIVKRACAALELPMPLIFVREDYQVPTVAVGFGEPYALVISSHWIEHFEDDELAFMIGRELGHIAAGHTRYLSLLSINGNENAIVALVFGGWLRTCAMTCDRVGLLVCGSLDAAARAIAISSFHHFGRHVNVKQFADQGREIASDGVLRLGEWLGGEPYATRRIAAMDAFIQSPLYATGSAWFHREIPPEPPKLAVAQNARVQRSDCAGMWRRGWAFIIDAVVVSALVLAFGDARGVPVFVTTTDQPAVHATAAPGGKLARDSVSWHTTATGITINANGVTINERFPGGTLVRGFTRYLNSPSMYISAYLWLLVGFAGQSFGMMIVGLRVVRDDFRPAGVWRSLTRYLVAFFLWPLIVVLAPFMGRLMLHDRISGTRLIRAERVMARAANAVTAG